MKRGKQPADRAFVVWTSLACLILSTVGGLLTNSIDFWSDRRSAATAAQAELRDRRTPAYTRYLESMQAYFDLHPEYNQLANDEWRRRARVARLAIQTTSIEVIRYGSPAAVSLTYEVINGLVGQTGSSTPGEFRRAASDLLDTYERFLVLACQELRPSVNNDTSRQCNVMPLVVFR